MSMGCVGSIMIYWTFPLFCCQVLLLYFYRDLLQTRMYYMMFAHQVHLDFMNIPFFSALSVRMMLGWMLLSFAMYPLAGVVTFRGLARSSPAALAPSANSCRMVLPACAMRGTSGTATSASSLRLLPRSSCCPMIRQYRSARYT